MTAYARCEDCGARFDTDAAGTWRGVTGWVVARTAGGANAVRDRHETGRYRCPPCGKLRDLGVQHGQEKLL